MKGLQPQVEITTLADMISAHASVSPERVCLFVKDARVSYGELNRAINGLANGLRTLGVKPGDKVAVLITNRTEFVVCFFAVLKLGAVVVPVNVKYKSEEVRYILDHSDSAVLIAAAEFAEVVEPVRDAVLGLERVVWVESPGVGGVSSSPGVDGRSDVRYDVLLQSASDEEPGVSVHPHDDAVMFYTSGTTGKPKGALCTHRNCLAAIDGWVAALGMTADCRSLMVTPFFHNAFNAFVVAPFRAGGSTVILDSFQMKALMKAIVTARPTLMFATPSIYITLLEGACGASTDLQSLTTVVYGAAPMPVEVIKRLRDVCPGASLFNAYAQSETCPAISFLEPRYALSKAGSVGKAVSGVTIAIMDETNRTVAPMEVGEICCRGANIMSGYYGQPELTAAKIVDGWLHTGDMGYVDEDGFLFLVNRKDDLIITGGENVYPQEVEEVLFAHPAILDAAVIGIPHPVRGQVVGAFLVPKAGQSVDGVSVRRYCADRLASFKVPRYVQVVEMLPRNSSGKILRAELRRRWESAQAVSQGDVKAEVTS